MVDMSANYIHISNPSLWNTLPIQSPNDLNFPTCSLYCTSSHNTIYTQVSLAGDPTDSTQSTRMFLHVPTTANANTITTNY